MKHCIVYVAIKIILIINFNKRYCNKMRNLDATICITLPANPALAEAQCFCLDSDHAIMWIATSTSLCCVSPDYQVSFNKG